MRILTKDPKEMRSYLLLWFTQMVSGLVSAMPVSALLLSPFRKQNPKSTGRRP